MAADAAVSLGVVVAAGPILLTGRTVLDPFAAILPSLFVASTAFDRSRASLGLSFHAVPRGAIPRGIDPAAPRAFLAGRPAGAEVHDPHVWPPSPTRTELTARLVMPGEHPGDALLAGVADELEHRFGIAHTTLPIEAGEGAPCRLALEEVVRAEGRPTASAASCRVRRGRSISCRETEGRWVRASVRQGRGPSTARHGDRRRARLGPSSPPVS